MEIKNRIKRIGEIGTRVGGAILVVGALKGPVGPVRAEKISSVNGSQPKTEMPLAREASESKVFLPTVGEVSGRSEEIVASGATFTTADGRTYGVGPNGQFLVDSPVETELVVFDSVDEHEGQFSVTTDGVTRWYSVNKNGDQVLVSEERSE